MTGLTKEQQMLEDSALLTRRALQIQRGAARAAVLGVNDGLVSVLCIVLAVAAAADSAQAVLIAGFAGLAAGAISMAAGEWISIKSQVELFEGVLGDLKRLVRDDRELLVSQLQENFESSGLGKKTGELAVAEISREDDHLTSEYARNVMGMNPDELGSPWTAAFSSFALFTVGALVALAPWFFAEGHLASLLSIIFTAIGGLIVGGYVGHSSGTSITKSAARQLLIILFASVVTYGLGHIVGTVV